MSVEKYKATEKKDFFEDMDKYRRTVVNEDTIKDIEEKIKKSKKNHLLEDVEEEKEEDLEKEQEESYENTKNYDLEDEEKEEEKEEQEKDLEEEKEEDLEKAYEDAENYDLEDEEKEEDIEEVDKIDFTSKKNKEEIIKEKQDVDKDIEETIEKHKKEDLEKTLKDEHIKPQLKFLKDLEDPNVVYLGRKKSVLKQYGKTASAYIGKVAENQQKGKQVHIDGLNPHVIFLDGARGTGKSYLLGVIAEELARTNQYIGQIVIDPVGVFWSMKFPNKDSKELKLLEEWGLKAEGLKNLKVFVPEGIKSQVSKDTYDDTFSMYPSLLTTEDWCLTFGIERFSPSGLLLEKTLESVKKGYMTGGTKEVPDIKKIHGKGNQYTLEDIINSLQNNSEFQSSQKGYKPDSIRALVSRFEAARSWGIFSDSGTPLSKLSRENQLTVLDTSFLDENITALVIGILARRILSARKLLARQEAASKFKENDQKAEELLEIEIPPTWMYIDEAHTLIPSGNSQTPATAGIIEYVKQGRRPGCSLVFATQQPSAINTKVLSQVDILISNKLVFNDDISAIQKRMPAIIPKQYKEPNFIKTLPFATALVGDRSEETSRAFILKAAPRRSQHEGRDAETIREVPKKNKSEVLQIAFNLIYPKLEKSKQIKTNFAKDILDVINIKYRADVYWDEILEKLFEKQVILEENILYLNKSYLDKKEELIKSEVIEEEESFDEIKEEVESISSPITKIKTRTVLSERINRLNIEEIAKSNIKKQFIIFKPKEEIQTIVLKYRAIYKMSYNFFENENDFKKCTCFIDSYTGEFIHFINSEFKISKGLKNISDLDDIDLDLLYLLSKQQTIFSLNQETDLDEKEILKRINNFKELKLITNKESNNREIYKLSENFDIPFNPNHRLLSSIDILPLKKKDVEFYEDHNYSILDIQEKLKKLWKAIEFLSTEEIYWPIWNVTYIDNKNNLRILKIDAITGKEM